MNVSTAQGPNLAIFNRRTYRVSTWYGLKNLAANGVGALLSPLGVVVLLAREQEGLLPLILFVGYFGYRAQFVLHDASHRFLFPNAKLGDMVATVVGATVGVVFGQYKRNHLLHHRNTGRPTDPQYLDFAAPDSSASAYLRFCFAPLWGGRLFPYLKRELAPLFKPRKRMAGHDAGGLQATGSEDRRTSSAPIALLILFHAIFSLSCLIVASNLFIACVALGFFYGSLGTLSLALARWRGVAEHQTYSEPLLDFSRNHAPSLFDRLTLSGSNFNFHLTHHLYPTLPPQYLRQVTQSEGLPITSTSMFSTLSEQFRLRLK